MRTIAAASLALVLVIVACTPTAQPSPASPGPASPTALSPSPATEAPGSPTAGAPESPTVPSPSPETGGVAGTTDERCAADDEACFESLLADAIALAEGIPTRVEVEEPESFTGGQRTANWVVYMADTIVLVNRFWANAFALGKVPYTHVNYVLIDAGQPDQRSNCTDDFGRPGALASANGGPFYCPVGGSGFGWNFQTGTVYIGIPLLVSESQRVNVRNYDFAVITIIAHEMGHHVEHLLFRHSLVKPSTATWWELGADCLAGVFAHNAYFGRAGQLTDSDVWEGMQMLHNWGSDLPYDYSRDPHGSRQQRTDAYLYGYNNGSTSKCLSQAWPTNF